MSFTPRAIQVLQILLGKTEPVSVKVLAQQVNASKRTVQRELGYLGASLAKYNVRFMSKTGTGVWLEGSKEAKKMLSDDILQADGYDAGNREERRKRLLLGLLREKGFQKIYYYSSQYGVSEATISTDLEALESWLSEYGLKIARKPGKGIAVDGSEASFRKAIRAFINENIDTRIIREVYEGAEDSSKSGILSGKNSISGLLNRDIVKRVMDCIAGLDSTRILTLTENSYTGLIIHISIAINRILGDEVIEPDERWNQNTPEDKDAALARRIVERLEEEFEIQIPEIEVSYICLHIKGAKHEKIQWEGDTFPGLENHSMQKMVNEMLDAFDKEQAYFLRQDDEFIQGLLAHLQPAIIRLVNGLPLHNPVLGDIQEKYPDIYTKSKRAAAVLENFTGRPVPPEETGFLAVHFGAALVRLESRREEVRRVNIGVVCSSGIGISRLMSTKLKRFFREHIEIATYGKKDISPYIEAKTDFFVSSIPLEKADIPVIYVNPLLNDEDMDKIRHMVYQYERTPVKQQAANGFSMQLEKINLVAAQINTVIKHMQFFKVDEKITFNELLVAVSEKLTPYSDRQEMIRQALARREEIASQIFAEFGFALLHTRTNGVIRPEFMVCMTRYLGNFENEYFKNIHVVFVMMAPDDGYLQINNDILGYISGLIIEEPGFMETVTTGDKEQIRNCLSLHLKKYFSKFVAGFS